MKHTLQISLFIALSGLAVACGGTQHTESSPAPEASPSPAPAMQPVALAVHPVLHATLRANRIEIDQMIEFDENSDHIQPASNEVLDHVASVLHDHPEIQHLRIEGNTDNLGTPARNHELSTQRAAAVAHYLHDHGVTIQLETVGFGATRALCTETTPECRARNRRVDFVVPGADGGA